MLFQLTEPIIWSGEIFENVCKSPKKIIFFFKVTHPKAPYFSELIAEAGSDRSEHFSKWHNVEKTDGTDWNQSTSYKMISKDWEINK